MNTIELNQLPLDVQVDVKAKLTAYDEAYVTLENGKFTYTAGLSLDTRTKAPDFKTFTITKDQVYNKTQQAQNYKELVSSMPNVPDSFWN